MRSVQCSDNRSLSDRIDYLKEQSHIGVELNLAKLRPEVGSKVEKLACVSCHTQGLTFCSERTGVTWATAARHHIEWAALLLDGQNDFSRATRFGQSVRFGRVAQDHPSINRKCEFTVAHIVGEFS